MLYDCFIFFNELELLEIRLNELDSIVDRFVLVESTRTHTNKPKNLCFAENKEKFSKFLNKIIYILVDDFPDSDDPLDLEIHQRNAIVRGLKDAKSDDVIMISDVDEIPRPKTVLQIKDNPGIKTLKQNFYYYCLNLLSKGEWLRGTKVLKYKDLTTPQEIRMCEGIFIDNGGWHFSYLGGAEKVKLKIQSFHHQEFNKPIYTDLKNIEKRIRKNKDPYERKGYKNKIVPIDETYPKYILNNLDKFKCLIKKQEESFLKSFFNRFR
ncbi:MAG: hypothetical protein ABIF17_01435 [Patescibacteria group bacterium]